ncbi:MAG: substrate-binding domain-containing protein [Brevinematales bacterium]|nr:substrate-binding domain-containing protein [Brevinematales bacterium]
MKWKNFNKRKRIGVLIHQYQKEIWESLISEAKKLDVDILFFVGRSLNSPYETEIPQNFIYEIPEQSFLDGLVIFSGTLGNFMQKEELERYLDKFKNLPSVSLFLEIKNLPSILIDNQKGIRQILEHLYEKHNVRRFAFIKGPSENVDSEERYKAFVEFLREKNLKTTNDFIIEGDFRFESGIDALKNLGEKIKDIEAIICANDNMAIGALSYINENVKDQILITGFDNIISSEGTIPPLTTVDINLKIMCEKALETISELIDGKDVPEKIYIEPTLIIRESCGCKRKEAQRVPLLTIEKLKKSFLAYNENRLEEADEILNLIIDQGIKYKNLENVLETYDREKIMDFLEYITTKSRQSEKNRLNNFYNEILMLRILTRDISCDISLKELKQHLVEKLGLLGIKDFYLFLFEKENVSSKDKNYLKLELAIEDSVKIEPLDKTIRFFSYLKEGKNLIFLPLSGRTDVYGIIVISYIENDLLYEILREQLSSTVKYIYVFQEKTETEKKLENALLNLNNLNKKYFSMLEYLPSAIFEINEDFSIEFLNKNAKELLMLGDNDIKINFLDFIFPEDRNRFYELYRKIKNGKELTELQELKLTKRSGSIVHFLFNTVPIVTENKISGMRISGFDIRPILSKSLSIDEEFFREFALSPREKDVLKLWMQGYQIKEIAATLFIAESTVKIHIGSIYSKLDVKNKAEFFDFIKNYQIKKFGYESFLFSILSQIIKN